jgi:anti-anti-sigma factor
MSDFNTEITIRDNIVVVKTHGYLDDAGGQVLRQKCVDLIDKGNIYFVFNLAGTPVINSTGLSMILDILVQIIDYSEGEAAICGLTSLTETALKMTGVLTLCESYPSEDEAIEAIKENIA